MLLSTALLGLAAAGILSAAGEPQTAADADNAFQPPVAARAWKSIVLHHSATPGGSVAAIDAAHRQQKDAAGRPWLGIGYHFVVGNGRGMDDGSVEPTFRWQQQLAGAHAGQRDANEQGIGICLIGNFDEQAPTAKQLAATRALLKTLTARYAIGAARVVRHHDVQATLCPGKQFPWEQVVADLPARDIKPLR